MILNKMNPSKTNEVINSFKKHKSENEIINQTLNSQKAIEVFGNFYKTDIHTGLKKTIEWYKKYINK